MNAGRPVEGDSWIDKQVSPSFLFITGLLLAPAVILQDSLIAKAAQTCLFLFLALLTVRAGRKRLLTGSVVFALSTVAINLLSPVGKVLFEAGPIRITQGALRLAVAKALTLVCLLYISRFCVRSSVSLPGMLGRYISKTFYYLNELLRLRTGLGRGNLVGRLDEIFDTVYNKQQNSCSSPIARTTAGGAIVLVILLAMNWGLVFFPY